MPGFVTIIEMLEFDSYFSSQFGSDVPSGVPSGGICFDRSVEEKEELFLQHLGRKERVSLLLRDPVSMMQLCFGHYIDDVDTGGNHILQNEFNK